MAKNGMEPPHLNNHDDEKFTLAEEGYFWEEAVDGVTASTS
jgi:hypothetical protein